MTAGVFLPAFAFTLLGHDAMERWVHRPGVAEFLAGVTAAVVGLIAGTTLALLVGSLTDLHRALVFGVALAVLFRYNQRWLVPAVIVAERHDKLKPVFNAAILLLAVVQFGLWLFGDGLIPLALLLTLFFVAFNVLEATQPSWISRIAAPGSKGTALGVYNTLQSVGLFLGGVLGGWLGQAFGPAAVSLFCAVLALVWLALASSMNPPPLRVTPAAAPR